MFSGKFHIVILTLITSIGACNDPVVEKKTPRPEMDDMNLIDSLKIIDFYKGNIPCSECTERLQQLWLMRKEIADTSGLFLLRETTWGEPEHEQVINTRGKWHRHWINDQTGKEYIVVELARDSVTGFGKRLYLMEKDGVRELHDSFESNIRKPGNKLSRVSW